MTKRDLRAELESRSMTRTYTKVCRTNQLEKEYERDQEVLENGGEWKEVEQ
jgi:hypothetical protein